MKKDIVLYNRLLTDIKSRVRQGQLRAGLSANTEMLAAYWDIGQMIFQRQQTEGWGARVIPRLARDLKNELSEMKGFTERNLKFMVQFYKEYADCAIGKLLVSPLNEVEDSNRKLPVSQFSEFKYLMTNLPQAKLEDTETQNHLILSTGWAHHIILIQKVKDLPIRYWYMHQSLLNGWSRDTLIDMIKNRLHDRQGQAATNFDITMPAVQSVLAKQILKDPYIFDFTTLAAEYSERELELELVKHVQKFLLELGAGFAFVGRQYKLEVSSKDFYLDLLFYHLKMRCFIVVELKKGDFLPEYAGKMNFYCSAVDDILKHETDNSTIGLILCQGKDKLFAEYALKDIRKPIGISEYELTRSLPENFKSSLPSIEEIEEELSEKLKK
jgi:predicted nuclease of restriction endonuclease-like (RecB) superfamily